MNTNNQYPSLFGSDISAAMAARPLKPEPLQRSRRTKVMTKKKILEQILLGFGQGHGSSYQPWLQIRRKNSSSKSNQVVSWIPPLNRAGHYFSRGEFHTALLLLWLGVRDLREQYPLWPIAHPHPLIGALGYQRLVCKWAPGLMEIANGADIEHGVNVGTNIPYVATLDFLAMACVEGEPRLVGISCKPISNQMAEVKERTLERLELERRYMSAVGGGYFVSNSALVLSALAGQLEWWLDCATLHCAPELLVYADRFADMINGCDDLSVVEAVTRAIGLLSISNDAGWLLFRHCAWTQKIDIDPMVQIVMSYPIKRGGVEFRSKLRIKLFGGDWK